MNQIRRSCFRAFDCPCSALLLNCCQFSCCLPRGVSWTDYSAKSSCQTECWMQVLSTTCPETKLRDLLLPGTHDSATYTIASWKPFSAVGKTQNCSIGEQLRAGARYLDVRVATCSSDSNDIAVWHGMLQGGSLLSVLTEIKEFVIAYPKEFVILEITPEYGRPFPVESKRICFQMLHNVLSDVAVSGEAEFQNCLQTKIGDLTKQMAVLVHSRFWENCDLQAQNIEQEFGFLSSDKYMRSKWHNTREHTVLMEQNLTELTEYGGQQKLLINNQLILTPGVSGAMDILMALLGCKSLRPVSLACRLYQAGVLDQFLRQNSLKPWNVVMLDFIDLCPALVHFLIALNFRTPLQIHLAIVETESKSDQPIDVTAQVRSHVQRNCVLFLTQVSNDLGLSKPDGEFTIAYSVGDEGHAHKVLSVKFTQRTQVLISLFTYNDDAVVCELPKEGQGHVRHGQIVLDGNDDQEKDDNGTAIAFQRQGTECIYSVANSTKL